MPTFYKKFEETNGGGMMYFHGNCPKFRMGGSTFDLACHVAFFLFF